MHNFPSQITAKLYSAFFILRQSLAATRGMWYFTLGFPRAQLRVKKSLQPPTFWIKCPRGLQSCAANSETMVRERPEPSRLVPEKQVPAETFSRTAKRRRHGNAEISRGKSENRSLGRRGCAFAHLQCKWPSLAAVVAIKTPDVNELPTPRHRAECSRTL